MGNEPNARAIFAAVIAVFFAFMGIGVVDPILPTIASEMGAQPWQTEMLFTSYLGLMAICMLFVAPISTRLGSRRTLLFALVGVIVFSAVCGLMTQIWPLAAVRAGWGLGNAFFTPTVLALIIGLSSNTNRAVTFFEAGLGLGIACGPLLGGFLGSISYHLPFFGTAALMLIGLIATFLLVKEPEARERPQSLSTVFKPFGNLTFLLVALTGMFYYYAYFTVLTYSPLFLHLSALVLGLIFFGWGVMVAIGSVWLVNRLLVTLKPTHLLIASLTILLLSFLAIIFVPSTPVRIGLIIFVGLPSGICNALYTALSVDVSPFSRSISTGAYNFLRWIGSACAPVLSGIFSTALAPIAPYVVAAIMVLICGIVLLLMGQRIDRSAATKQQAQNLSPQPI
ncbi:MAG: MFS transporter [Firmicutes bacterium]|nr:MFS transporter [Bacillota bacterium]